MSTTVMIILACFVFTILLYPPVCEKPWKLTKEQKEECKALKKKSMNLQIFLFVGVVLVLFIGYLIPA